MLPKPMLEKTESRACCPGQRGWNWIDRSPSWLRKPESRPKIHSRRRFMRGSCQLLVASCQWGRWGGQAFAALVVAEAHREEALEGGEGEDGGHETPGP